MDPAPLVEMMDVLNQGRCCRSFLLIRGEGEVLAHLEFHETEDFPWLVFHFSPLSAWEGFGQDREIFYGSPGLAIREAIELRIRSIQNMDLWLVAAGGGARLGDFIFYIRGDLAYFRSHPRGQTIRISGSAS